MRLAPKNRRGDPVDPWPILVVIGMTFLAVFSFGPGYLLTFGFDPATALLVSGVVFVCLAVAVYYRLVWTARPDLAGEIPAETRIRRLLVWAAIVTLVFFGLSLPFLVDLF